jgi:hypothetical protein
MTKKFCKQCGSALTKARAKFCTICGATVDVSEPDDVESRETAPLPGEQQDQTVSADVAATEVLPASKPPSNYTTEEMPQVGITARADERATAVFADAPVTQSPTKHAAQANKQTGGRKKLALVVALVVVALASGSSFFVISRGTAETQGADRPSDQAEPAASAQPAARQSNQQSGDGAKNQAQPQTRLQSGSSIGEAKSSDSHSAGDASNPQRQAATNPTPATSQENQTAGGTGPENHINQGIKYMNSGSYQEALQEYEYAKKLDPSNKDVYYLIGYTYQGMNQLEKALEAYRQCTSGTYHKVAQNAVKRLEKQIGKVSAK